MMKEKTLYTGERGAHYYSQRKALRSDNAQKERADYFIDLEDETASILDFGCGNGGVLAHLRAAIRIGVEISPYAAQEAKSRVDSVVDNIAYIPDESIDIAISYHALEHIEAPAATIRHIHRVLRPGGKLRIIVPCEMPFLQQAHRHWRAGDTDMHLFTWSPLHLGNLLTLCGFDIQDSKIDPCSAGGRIGSLFPKKSKARRICAFCKAALQHGRFQTIITCKKRA